MSEIREQTPPLNDYSAPAANAAPAADKASRWEDYIEIWFAPARVFARRATASPWFPILVTTALITALAFANQGVIGPILDADFERGFQRQQAENPQLTREMAQQFRGFGEAMATFGLIVLMPLMFAMGGLVTWAAGKLFGSQASIRQMITVSAIAASPRILEQVLVGIQGLLLDAGTLTSRNAISIGPARFLDPDVTTGIVGALAFRTDVFTLGCFALVAIGASVVGKVPRAQGAMIAAAGWLAGTLAIAPSM